VIALARYNHPIIPNASHTIRKELGGIIAFIAAIWAVFAVSLFFPGIDSFGVIPRTLRGLIGIPLAPFLHANIHHLLANTLPLCVLLGLVAGSQWRTWEVVGQIVLIGGFLLWLVGSPAIHIGASGLIFGLIVFLIVSGLIEKRPVPLAVAVLVAFFYGGALVSGVMPRFESEISWDGHLYSAIAGALVACNFAGQAKKGASDA
jgi:membrane associated rhomboid family serine protease